MAERTQDQPKWNAWSRLKRGNCPRQDCAEMKFSSDKGHAPCLKAFLLQSVTGDYVEDEIYYDLLDPAGYRYDLQAGRQRHLPGAWGA